MWLSVSVTPADGSANVCHARATNIQQWWFRFTPVSRFFWIRSPKRINSFCIGSVKRSCSLDGFKNAPSLPVFELLLHNSKPLKAGKQSPSQERNLSERKIVTRIIRSLIYFLNTNLFTKETLMAAIWVFIY